MERSISFYENIVNGIASGVLSLNPEGIVTSFNPMASEITGLPAEAVIGKKFSELIIPLEGADEFFDVILDAVYDASVAHQRTVEASFGNRRYYLSVTTTYIQEERGGESVKTGVLAVFEDISEIRELHLQELSLKKELQAKHEKLLDAFREIEAGNRQLRAASRKVRALRLGAAVFALFLLATLGAYLWKAGLPLIEEREAADAGRMALPGVLQDAPGMVVSPRRVISSISIPGRLEPKRQVEITAPLEGKVSEIRFRYGHRVAKGQTLMEMDVEPTRIEHRRARIEHIKARKRLKELEDLSGNVAVSRARRAVERNKAELQVNEEKLSKSAFLLGRGLIPASEHEAAKRTDRNLRLNLQAAELDLKVILADAEINREAARLELDNARVKLEALAEIIRRSKVRAPVSGVVMRPRSGAGSFGRQSGTVLTKGASVKQGDYLLTIGDFSGLKIVGDVDEVDIVRIRAGQAATIVGDAFPGTRLKGEVAEVAQQATGRRGWGRGPPRFEVAAVVEDITDAQRKVLRLGMSAKLRIVVYDKPNALVVPVHAVNTQSSRPRLLIKDKKTGEARLVEVVTGVTTVSDVEILEGIEAGDEIILPPR